MSGLWCSWMQPRAWPNSWSTTRAYSVSSVVGVSQPKFMVASCRGTWRATVPSWDHEPFPAKLTRIWAAGSSPNVKRTLACCSQPCAGLFDPGLHTGIAVEEVDGQGRAWLPHGLGPKTHPRAGRFLVLADGHDEEVVGALRERGGLNGRDPVGRHDRIDADVDAVVLDAPDSAVTSALLRLPGPSPRDAGTSHCIARPT